MLLFRDGADGIDGDRCFWKLLEARNRMPPESPREPVFSAPDVPAVHAG